MNNEQMAFQLFCHLYAEEFMPMPTIHDLKEDSVGRYTIIDGKVVHTTSIIACGQLYSVKDDYEVFLMNHCRRVVAKVIS